LARDRMGVKPLYYAHLGSPWLFSSEIKALVTREEISRDLELDSLADYLRFSYVPGEATPYKAVRRLLPGHFIILEAERQNVKAWWDLAADWDGETSTDADEICDRLVSTFDDAVKLRMRSDVPVASFLSGGVDSSLI